MAHSDDQRPDDGQEPNTFKRVGEGLNFAKLQQAAECAVHGPYTQEGYTLGRRVNWLSCPLCSKEKTAADDQLRRQADADEKQRRLEAQLQQTGVPLRYRGKGFHDFSVADDDQATADAKANARVVAMEFASNFAEHYRRGSTLIFSGDKGTGKTHLACAIAQQIMGEHTAMYATAMDAIRMVRDTWGGREGKKESAVLETLGRVGLLILDEIGAQYGTAGEKVVLFDILDKRYRDMRPTIILTNLDKAELQEVLGERSYDRLREAGRWVAFPWASSRPPASRRRVDD